MSNLLVDREFNVFIMDTDYNTYALLYECGIMPQANLWILSRQRTLDNAKIEELKTKFPAHGEVFKNLQSIEQVGCQ